ncbi:hypothetical protein, partial [uncultured Bacteroides sp.]|uniref:hypothetical protein n=1 Tax=uncultured Bacteroides sp. TaxID=162156 RepID=UPI002603E378
IIQNNDFIVQKNSSIVQIYNIICRFSIYYNLFKEIGKGKRRRGLKIGGDGIYKKLSNGLFDGLLSFGELSEFIEMFFIGRLLFYLPIMYSS